MELKHKQNLFSRIFSTMEKFQPFKTNSFCVCVCVWERERERERDSYIERKREREMGPSENGAL